MSATTLFTVYKHIQPDERTIEVTGEISIGDETVDVSSDVTVEFDEEQHTVEIKEEDIEELYPREAHALLSALLQHHVLPAVDALAETPGMIDPLLMIRKNHFRQAVSQMQGIIADAMRLSKEGAA
tara:strand:- start:55 stop:432 length:378 start_codon:yes stop_codon:yes gene_type:complete